MNQRFLGGLTAALMATSFGQVMPLQASEPAVGDDRLDGGFSQTASLLEGANQAPSNAPAEASAVKIGEYRSKQLDEVDEAVAAIHAHEMDNRQAATLYVRDIPVLTTLGGAVDEGQAEPVGSAQVKVGQPASVLQKQSVADGAPADAAGGDTTVASVQDPVLRATAIAARLNQAHREQFDPSNITARWESKQETYVIKLGDEVLVTFDNRVTLPNSTGNEAEDVLQIANRIRRQLGAEPLTEIEGAPEPPVQEVAVGPMRVRFSGMASWYGPGFHGRRSASGEVFNQNALTAAHPSLPFGTLLQVTNANTGSTVTVRVNDRGPYAGHRVIDLSAGAARAIGMIRSGVAPVRVEVLGQGRAAN